MRVSLIIASLAIILPTPAWAAKTLGTLIESEPCITITLPSGGKACVPPKVSQGCITVTVRERGKSDRKVVVCDQPRSPKEAPKPSGLPKPIRGY